MAIDSPSSRNLALYPAYVACLNGFFWFPVFFLFFSLELGLAGALRLEAIYYFSVVLFEVPSGFASDRMGRRFALRVAAALLTAAYVVFYVSDAFWGFAVGQVLLAAGFAFNSGTDTAFHYDSLVAVGKEDEFADREQRIVRLSFAVTGLSALVGGFIGSIELRLAYLVSAVVMGVGLLITLAFDKPEAVDRPAAERIDRQLAACVRDLRHPALAWLFAASVLLTVLIHVPYQLYQPYLELLGAFGDAPTPAISGAHAFAAMMVAAALSSRSVWSARRFGTRPTILAALLFGVFMIAALAVTIHPLIALLLVFRSGSRALIQAPLNAAVTPRIPAERRASYLSLQSLAGRLSFSAVLLALATTAGAPDSATNLAQIATLAAAIGGAGWLLLAIVGRGLNVETDGPAAPEPEH